MTPDTINGLLEQVYREGGNYEGPLSPGDFGVGYSDAYLNRTDTGSGYMEASLPLSLRRLEESLCPVMHEFDVIVVSGLSGIVPGAILAHAYDKQLVVIRKDDDCTHGVRTEGRDHFVAGTPYVVIDDFISSGATIHRIFDKMEELGYGLPLYVALYSGTWFPTRASAGGKFIYDARHVTASLYSPYRREKPCREILNS